MNNSVTKYLIIFLAFSAITYSQPLFKISIHGGYSLALPDLKGDLKDSADQHNTLTMGDGFNFGIDGKVYPFKNRNIAFTLSINYNMFRTSVDSANLYFDIFYIPIEDAEYKLNSLSLGIGAEYSFLPGNNFNPFAGAEINSNYFTGSKTYISSGMRHSELDPALRFGFALGAGFDISLSRNIELTAGGKYNFANLIGKESTFTELDEAEYPLFDGEIETFDAKNIPYLRTYLGISFLINQPRKIRK